MDHDGKNNWRELCRAAASELDPEKLMRLIAELTKALDEREGNRKTPRGSKDVDARQSLRSAPAM